MQTRIFRVVTGARLLFVIGALSACAAPRVDITPRLGTFDVEGEIGVSSTNVAATNSVDAMGLVEDDSVFSGRVDFDWGGIHVTASAQQSTHDGDGVLEADLSQGGVTITAGTTVVSELDLGLYSGIVTFDLFPGETFELGLGLGATLADFDASFTDGTSGDTIATDESVPIPVFAARAAVALGPVDVSALFGGMAITLDGNDANYYDIDVMARVRVLGDSDRFAGSLALGWRQVDLDAEYDDDDDEVDLDLQFSGPYFGLTFAF